MGVDIKMYAVKIKYPNGRYGMAGKRTGKKGKTWSSVGAFKSHLANNINYHFWPRTPEDVYNRRYTNAIRAYGDCIVEEVKVENGKAEAIALPFAEWCERNNWPSRE